jgi:PAS domain S-box-containing protein
VFAYDGNYRMHICSRRRRSGSGAWAVKKEEMAAEMARLRARAERAEAALQRVHDEQARAPWSDAGVPTSDPNCPYRSLIDNLDALILFIDRHATICYANGYAAEFVGLERDDLQQMPVRDLLDRTVVAGPEHDETIEALLVEPEMPRVDEVDMLRPDGTEACISWATRPVRDAEGDLLGVVAIGTDISARREMERQRAKYQESLRSMASELVLAEEQQRRSIATRIHEEISQDLAYAKLRVCALNGAVEDDGCSEQINEINDLLDDAIAGTRALAFELSPPLLHELGFSEAVEWLAEQFEDRHEIDCEVAGGSSASLPHAVGLTLFRAVGELLSNIVEHSGANEARITIEQSNGSVVVRVTDDGRGFDADEPLEQREVGKGFGLFTIRERLDYLGGDMSIRSGPLVGTEVTLTAPTNGSSG